MLSKNIYIDDIITLIKLEKKMYLGKYLTGKEMLKWSEIIISY